MAQVECLRFQQDQIRALSFIYLEELQLTKQSNPYKFNILCKPFKGNDQEYQLNITFEYTKTYPKTPIKYEIEPLAGITRDNLKAIVQKIQEIICLNQNKPIVYDIIQQTRLWIEQYLVQGKAYQQQSTQKVKKQQIFERPKFASFTPVTVESFNIWKKQFDQKHKKIKIEKKQGQIKLTGKQWFLGKHEDIVQSQQDEDQQDQEQEEQQKVIIPTQENNDLFD